MKVIYYHNFRNEKGYIETERQYFYNVEDVWLENLKYCDNGTWLMIHKKDKVNAIEIEFGEDDEFAIVGE